MTVDGCHHRVALWVLPQPLEIASVTAIIICKFQQVCLTFLPDCEHLDWGMTALHLCNSNIGYGKEKVLRKVDER